jgi:hypothetical protein
MNELASLLPFLLYAVTIVVLAALVQRLVDAGDAPSLAGLVSGRSDLPWPRGVQEEEPVRWHIEALRPWRGQRATAVTRMEPDRRCSAVQGFGPRQACPPPA